MERGLEGGEGELRALQAAFAQRHVDDNCIRLERVLPLPVVYGHSFTEARREKGGPIEIPSARHAALHPCAAFVPRAYRRI